MLALLTLLELIILLVVAWRMANAPDPYMKASSESPLPTSIPPPTLTKSQLNTQALLRWQDSFDLLEARSNGTSRSGRSKEGQGK